MDETRQGKNFTPKLDQRNRNGRIFQVICLVGTFLGIILLALLMLRVLADGLPRLDWNAIANVPSQVNPDEAGFRIALLGTMWITVFTLMIAVPLGVGSAIYLEEYAPKNRFTQLLELNIANLAGVPSVIYGVLGLGLFVRLIGLGPVVLAGSMTMSLVILPVIIVASREAIRSVPLSMREASYGVGATKWQTISNHVLPYSLPGILTGVIIGVSRAIGDSASLLIIGGLVFITTNPNLFSRFIVLPLQIYFNISQPQDAYKQLAAAGIIILLVALLILNASAIYVRNRFEQRY
ncbi:MAG: phosphate ABC transporter permease PstA [Synechococcaceae cyanobacterium SM2_3_1]|nr:phosphate ABC transporter permease PstA [Synechococcaceae cyanobacterium SM2_3_1]